jgi:hypothetical protein
VAPAGSPTPVKQAQCSKCRARVHCLRSMGDQRLTVYLLGLIAVRSAAAAAAFTSPADATTAVCSRCFCCLLCALERAGTQSLPSADESCDCSAGCCCGPGCCAASAWLAALPCRAVSEPCGDPESCVPAACSHPCSGSCRAVLAGCRSCNRAPPAAAAAAAAADADASRW